MYIEVENKKLKEMLAKKTAACKTLSIIKGDDEEISNKVFRETARHFGLTPTILKKSYRNFITFGYVDGRVKNGKPSTIKLSLKGVEADEVTPEIIEAKISEVRKKNVDTHNRLISKYKTKGKITSKKIRTVISLKLRGFGTEYIYNKTKIGITDQANIIHDFKFNEGLNKVVDPVQLYSRFSPNKRLKARKHQAQPLYFAKAQYNALLKKYK